MTKASKRVLATLAAGMVSCRHKISTTSNAGVRGKAKDYPYYAAAVYRLHVTCDGRIIWRATGKGGPARRGVGVLRNDCCELADQLGCDVHSYGGSASLHNVQAV